MKMNTKNINPQSLRDKYIRALDSSNNSTQKAKELAEDLFALDLTVYSKSFSFDSLIYNAFAQSYLDENISLHPEQLALVEEINKNNALIISAPTSFGKTFSVFEYISRKRPQSIVLIVPTLALVDEYLKKIIKKYSKTFRGYSIHTNIDKDAVYNFEKNNIFILTHDRVVQETAYSMIEKIDLLVIDEVYKLEKDISNDRVLVLNLAYYYLSKKANKYILLAPFINDIEDKNELEKKPNFYKSLYSPVVNEVKTIEIVNEKDRNYECKRIIDKLSSNDKTLIYFPTVTGIYKYVNEIIVLEEDLYEETEEDLYTEIDKEIDEQIKEFIKWAEDEIHEEWYLVKALKYGYLVHNGQLPIGIRLFQMDLYEKSTLHNKMLCTSTLLEGVNTTAKNIIITKPSRTGKKDEQEKPFTAFDFYNLVGRTGRLNQHYLGIAYYLRGPNEPIYNKNDAIRSIKFEITDNSKDMDIQRGNISDYPDFIEFLTLLGISYDEYIEVIGGRPRFDTVKDLYNNYLYRKNELLVELNNFLTVPNYGRFKLINVLLSIIEGKQKRLEASIINQLLNLQRLKTKTIIENTIKKMKSKSINIDYVISNVIRLKTSYIEHDFYTKTLLIRFFLEKNEVEKKLISVLDQKVISSVEKIYFSTSKHKKMLIDLGIYERDIDKIINVIGEDFEDASELKKRLSLNIKKLTNISFISKYVINNIL